MLHVRDDQEDQHDLSGAARGDHGAAARLYDRHAKTVFAIGYSMLGTRERAEDIVQDVFLKMWQQADNIQSRGVPVRPWLMRVASNQCIDRMRKHREVLSEHPIDQEDEAAGPHNDLEQSDLGNHLEQAFAQLPDRQRMALTLTAKLGFTTREAGDAMDLGERAVESLVARARKSMRVFLQPVAADYFEK